MSKNLGLKIGNAKNQYPLEHRLTVKINTNKGTLYIHIKRERVRVRVREREREEGHPRPNLHYDTYEACNCQKANRSTSDINQIFFQSKLLFRL